MEKTLTRNTFIGGRLIEASEEYPVTIEVDDLTEASMVIAPSTPIGNATPEQLAGFLRHRTKLAPTEMLDLIYGKGAFAQGQVELEPGEPRRDGPEQAPVILSGGGTTDAHQTSGGLPLDNTAPSSNPAVIADALRVAPADLREAAGLSRDPPPPKTEGESRGDSNDPYARQNKEALAAELAKRPHIDATDLTTRAKMIEALEQDDAKPKA